MRLPARPLAAFLTAIGLLVVVQMVQLHQPNGGITQTVDEMVDELVQQELELARAAATALTDGGELVKLRAFKGGAAASAGRHRLDSYDDDEREGYEESSRGAQDAEETRPIIFLRSRWTGDETLSTVIFRAVARRRGAVFVQRGGGGCGGGGGSSSDDDDDVSEAVIRPLKKLPPGEFDAALQFFSPAPAAASAEGGGGLPPGSLERVVNWLSGVVPHGRLVTLMRTPLHVYLLHFADQQLPGGVGTAAGAVGVDVAAKFEAFLADERFRNPQAAQFGLYSDEQLEEFLSSWLGRFELIALCERLDESLVILRHLFHWHMSDLLYLAGTEVDPSSRLVDAIASSLPSRLLKRAAEQLTLDSRLYDAAAEAFDRLLEALPAYAVDVELRSLVRHRGMLEVVCKRPEVTAAQSGGGRGGGDGDDGSNEGRVRLSLCDAYELRAGEHLRAVEADGEVAPEWRDRFLEAVPPHVLHHHTHGRMEGERGRHQLVSAQSLLSKKRPSGAEELVVVATHTLATDLPRLAFMVNAFPGFISAAVYCHSHAEAASVTEQFLRAQGSPKHMPPWLRAGVDLHLIIRDVHYRPTPGFASHYPINLLRNAAMQLADPAARTFVMVDIDFLPIISEADMRRIDAMTRSHRPGDGAAAAAAAGEWVAGEEKVVFVLPALEWVAAGSPGADQRRADALLRATDRRAAAEYVREIVPAGKKAIRKHYALGELTAFHARSFHRGHASTIMARWLDADEPYALAFIPDSYEPRLLVPRGVPLFDEYFVGRRYNTASHCQELAVAGFIYHVLPDSFTLHVAHEKRDSKKHPFELKDLSADFNAKMEHKYRVKSLAALPTRTGGPTDEELKAMEERWREKWLREHPEQQTSGEPAAANSSKSSTVKNV